MNPFWLAVSAAVLVALAGLFSAAEAAISSFSRARAEELSAEGRAGSKPLLEILDDPARFLNTALFLRLFCEVAAIVLVTQFVSRRTDRWAASVVF